MTEEQPSGQWLRLYLQSRQHTVALPARADGQHPKRSDDQQRMEVLGLRIDGGSEVYVSLHPQVPDTGLRLMVQVTAQELEGTR
jgi:hypothetical protein